SVNDTSDRAALNKEAYESLLLKLWNAESKPAVVTIAMTQDNGTSLQELHGEIAKKLGIPMISYKDAVLSVIKRGDIAWKDISDDNIHPNVTGHALLTDIIMDNLESVISDEITDEEPALPTEAKYTNAHFVYADNTEPTSLGGFAVNSAGIGGFANSWVAKNAEGAFTENDALELEITAKNIGIVYGKLTGKYTKADVYIDGEYRATLDGNFSGGWGSYAVFAEIASFDEESKHTVKIVPQTTEGASAFYVCRIAVS
ncbi:MAG: SGNH/GDSL hydrolase family protein, partial [Oscillospiraceae bacterium]|nr:SGNH/GDSL hydrolase family protein [Oscillospiraceae bacterium]